MDDLVARFLPRFIESTRARIRRCRELVAASDGKALASEMHTLVGEASVLALVEIATLAREVEHAARRSALEDCPEGLTQIEQGIARLAGQT